LGDVKVLSSEEFSLTRLNKPADWTNLTIMDKKHTPIIEAPSKVKANEPFAVKGVWEGKAKQVVVE